LLNIRVILRFLVRSIKASEQASLTAVQL